MLQHTQSPWSIICTARSSKTLALTDVSPRYGAYDYPGILASLRTAGFDVVSEIRAKGTDPSSYADRVAADIRGRLVKGTLPGTVTVIGASKGAVIASLVSTRLKQSQVRYVLLAACNDWLLREMKPQLTGEVLSIYEASDEIGQSCRPVVAQSPAITKFDEVRLDTGLGHGIVYRPLEQWVKCPPSPGLGVSDTALPLPFRHICR